MHPPQIGSWRAIVDAVQQYAEWPLSAPARGELAPDLRGFPIVGYMVYYTQRERGSIRVERIIHGARNQAALFARAKRRSPRVAVESDDD